MLAIVGPGRLGQALGRRLIEAGESFVGVFGGSGQTAGKALRFLGQGKVLRDAAQLHAADLVLLCVPDDSLAGVAQSLAEECPGERLWVHTSGSHDLAVLSPLRAVGGLVAGMHPLCPVPDPEIGYRNLAGQPVVIEAAREHRERLVVLAERAGLRPFCIAGTTNAAQRQQYHAACVLASNGGAVLFAAAESLMAEALPGVDVRALVSSLMQRSVQSAGEQGPVAALSGPAVRGDAGTMRRQTNLLGQRADGTAAIYRVLLRQAVRMAAERGLHSEDELARLLASVADPASDTGL